MKKIIERIILFRKDKGITQKDIAEKLETSVVSYSKIERGETQLTIEKIFNIAKALNIDPISLLHPNFDQVKYHENLKKEISNLKAENHYLKKGIDSQNSLLSLIYAYHPEIHELIEVNKHLTEYPPDRNNKQ